MNFLQRRRLRKLAHLAAHMVRHALRMRGDIAPPADIASARHAAQSLRTTLAARDWPRLETACETAAAAAERLMPPRPHPKWRENVEVLVVAIALAMACRTYFIQPFKIPTGSMQPTLYGVTARPQHGKQLRDRFPLNLLSLALHGERYVEIRARASGVPELLSSMQDDQFAFRIGREIHLIRLTMRPDSPYFNPDPARSMTLHFQPGARVKQGDLLATGRIRMGDHILVNKLLYHFARPQRGQIVVFDTNHIPGKELYGIAADNFYIKRLVGLPNETISIRDRHLLVNNTPVTAPAPFLRQTPHPDYDGYVPRRESRLPTPQSAIQTGPGSFLPFGDNTYSSLDGRYFGPVPYRALVGPAFFVYWPLGPRWGHPQ